MAPDPFAAERALERSLVDSGALLLQPGFFDVAPFVGYSRTETTAAGLVVDADGFPDFGQSQVRRNVVDLGANLRGGLPFESQLEVGIPFRYVDRTIVNSSGFQPLVSDSGSNFTFGDMTVGLAKTLLREDQGFVDVIGRVTGRLPTGDDVVNDVVTGGGFAGVSGGLTVTRREDPLVFVGSAGYEELFESDNVDPGSEISWSLTTFLAVTPNTSLKFGVNQAFLGKTEINGRVVDGSDGVATSLVLGGSAVLTPRALLDVSVAAGLTDAASDFSIFATLPLRFDFPLLAD